ncbi:conserved hypothetical protein [Candidatus Terasakiella magnetica]|uniref:Glycosyltransferase n=1 Tax=Candidatus Terasakiella magnetica TaxID=1867952 RepID=A0A1C3RG44_9PROT|nr:glycosyltransferase [Candidatus Terasakiella magnetica]SCA56225.1 conserved hypothetical protein [Candidatus Terasakiella magnetica]
MKQVNLKVAHVPKNVAGLPANLAHVEKSLGLDSKCSVLVDDPFVKNHDAYFSSGAGFLSGVIDRFRLFLSILDVDIIHYNFGRCIFDWGHITYDDAQENFNVVVKVKRTISEIIIRILSGIDVRIFHLLGKKLCVTYQGDDARVSTKIANKRAYYPEISINPARDEINRSSIEYMSRYMTHIFYVNPDLGNYLPENSTFVPYAHISLDEWEPKYQQNKIPKILHAPSNRSIKGTEAVLKALTKLKDEGAVFELVLVEKMNREQARKHYEACDLLIDQLIIGWYGGLAVELMALGKPVICYLHQDDLSFIPKGMQNDIPIISADVFSIYDQIKLFLNMSLDERHRLGIRSRKYVEQWHNQEKIVSQLIEVYKQ